jgi:hypothetical protein
MRLPKFNMAEPGWPQFLVGMLIVSPIFGAFLAGQWIATTLPYSIALLGITAAILSWLFTTAMALLLNHRRSTLVSFIVIEGVLTTVSFSIVTLQISQGFNFTALMMGVNAVIMFIGAYIYDRRHPPSTEENEENEENGAAEG